MSLHKDYSFETVLKTCYQSESESRSVMSKFLRPHGLYSPWNSPGQNTGVGSLFLLQGIFSNQGLNLGLPHCRQILYQLNQLILYHRSPRILGWVAYPFSSRSSQPRNQTRISHIVGRFFTNWAMREVKQSNSLEVFHILTLKVFWFCLFFF